MKTPWIAVLTAVILCAAAVGAISYRDAGKIAALEKKIADLQALNAKLTGELAEAGDRANALAAESAQLRAVHEEDQTTAAAAIPAASPAASPDKPKTKGANFFTQMFKDPAMRKMIASQQAAAMRGIYSDFLKEAHLSPDQAEQFFKLLGDRATERMDLGAALMSGSQTNAAAATSASDDALKNLLGPDGFSAFQGYEKSLGGRMMVQQLGQQLSSEGIGLQDYQSNALIQIMGEEQSSMPQYNGANGSSQLQNMTDAQVSQYEQQLQAADQKIYNRAMSVLSGAQLTAFHTYQQNMETAQLAGLKMARQMFNTGQ